MTTTIETAFETAGHRSGSRRVREAADEAFASCNGDFEEGIALLDMLVTDIAMMRALVGEARMRAALSEALGAAAARARGEVPVSGYTRKVPNFSGQRPPDAHIGRAADEAEGGQTGGDPHRATAAPASPTPGQRTATKAVAQVLANSLLLSIQIDGVPLKLCTKGRVLASADQDARLGRFKRALVAPLPDGNAVVGDYLTDDDAGKAWEASRGDAE